MEINEIKLLFGKSLVFFESILDDSIKKIGIPIIVLDKYIPYYKETINFTIFSKSNISNIFLGIDKRNKNVICFSDEFQIFSFVNSDYRNFIKVNFIYETFRKICLLEEKYGAYYDDSPEGGNFEKYANVLEMLIKDIDERATKEGIWHSLIEEMRLGVI